MKPFYYLLMWCIVVVTSTASFAQFDAKLPKIIPPSPDAASLGKYADIPVSTYTGIPQISIPLYEINSRDVSVPISLSYHASGVKVEEEASWVGLGWSLNATGTITRMVKGNDDLSQVFNNKGYVYSQEVPEKGATGIIPYLKNICNGLEDGQPDIFYYNILGYTGKFYLQRKNTLTGSIKVVLLSDKEKIKIDYNEAQKTWTVITKDGYKYILGTKEYTKSVSFPLFGYDFPRGNPDYMFTQDEFSSYSITDDRSRRFISAWFLDKVISPTKEEINFYYTDTPKPGQNPYASKRVLGFSENRRDIRGIGSAWSIDDNCDDSAIKNWIVNPLVKISSFGGLGANDLLCLKESPPAPSCGQGKFISGSVNITLHQYLQKIEFHNGKIEFVTSDREDIERYYDHQGKPVNDGGVLSLKRYFSKPQKLDRIDVSGPGFSRSINFNYSYFTSSGTTASSSNQYALKRLKLNSIIESTDRLAKKPYKFNYNGDNLDDNLDGSNSSLPAKNSFSRDHWGYYNKVDNRTLIPEAQFETVTIGVNSETGEIVTIPDGRIEKIEGANRKTDEASSVAAVLNRIQYPTGGSTDFTYESNTFNLEEGAKEPKHFFVPASVKEFELTERALVTLTSQLNCSTLSCFGGSGSPSDKACTDGQIRDLSQAYFEIVSQSTGQTVFGSKAIYGDYYKKLGKDTPDLFGVSATNCGVERTTSLTMDPGKYIINIYSMFGFIANGNVDFTQKILVASDDLIRKGGGIRVKQIVDHDGINEANNVVKKFDYTWKDGQNRVLSTGRLMTMPIYTYYQSAVSTAGSGATSVCDTFISDSYSNVPLGSSAQGSLVGYDRVSIIYGVNGENGKSIYYYRNEPDILPDFRNEPYFPNSPTITHSPSNGLLLKEEHLTKDGIKVREVISNYNQDVEAQQVKGFMIRAFNGCLDRFGSVIQYHWYYEPSEWWHIGGTYEKDFDITDPLNVRGAFKFTNFEFNNPVHKQLTRSVTTRSDGSNETEFISYPLDLHLPELSVMWDETNPNYKHMHSMPLQKQTIIDGQITSGEKTNYSYFADMGMVLPVGVELKQKSGAYEQRYAIQKYDEKGNILELIKKDNIVTSFVWGYLNTLPIAQAVNATSNQIYHTSFEESGNADGNVKTGKKCWVNSVHGTYIFTPDSNFSPVPNSILSYWYWDGASWKRHEETYSGGSVALSLGTKVDELRIFPSSAQMTTFTYDPLVGSTSVTDANGQTTYYEYDKLNRLKAVKDPDKNVVKRYDYQFKN